MYIVARVARARDPVSKVTSWTVAERNDVWRLTGRDISGGETFSVTLYCRIMVDPYAHDAERAKRFSGKLAEFMARWRHRIHRRPWLNVVYKAIVTALGALVILAGILMLVLPGPGWLTIFIGLAILGTEYHWARRLLGWLRKVLARLRERWNLWRAERRARKEDRASEAEQLVLGD